MKQTLTLIAALADDRVIGRDGGLPWHLPADLAHFKLLTWGKPVLMGRRTYQAIGKPLHGRLNVVVTHDAAWRAEGVTVAHSLDEALRAAGDAPEVMVIGGAQLYAECLPRARRLQLTRIHAQIDGDVRFPEFDLSLWDEVERHEHPADARNPHRMTFLSYRRA